MKFLIAGGGTGGHIFTGIAIAEGLKRLDPQHEICFVGTNSGLEARVVPQAGFKLQVIEISGLKARSFGETLRALIQLPLAIWASIQILRKFDPQVVIGVGGYASGPVLLAAWLLRIPRGICEQNSIPGFTNRVLGRYFAKHVWGAFKKCAHYFPTGNFELTGNPLRENFMRRALREPPQNQVLVLGGSLGAKPLNEMLPGALALVRQSVMDLQVMHQTGQADLLRVQQAYVQSGVPAQVLSFIEDMPRSYEKAKLVIARAGAITCSELTALGIPSILIPFPQAADDHQTENARELVEAGASIMLAQEDMNEAYLAGSIQHLLLDLKSLENMANKARQIGRTNAADIIAQKVVELC